MPAVVEEQALALLDTAVLLRWVAALAAGILVLGILVGLVAARAPLPVYVLGD